MFCRRRRVIFWYFACYVISIFCSPSSRVHPETHTKETFWLEHKKTNKHVWHYLFVMVITQLLSRKFAFMIPSKILSGKKILIPFVKHTAETLVTRSRRKKKFWCEIQSALCKKKQGKNLCVSLSLWLFPQFDNTIFFRTKEKQKKTNVALVVIII